MNRSSPPGRSTRRISDKAAAGERTEHSINVATTASYCPSPPGRCSAVPSATVISAAAVAAFRSASARRCGSGSIARTRETLPG